ncbi:DUF4292 domain-containing protein [Leptobacterium sp. I13]|uniref:DUF4292 domain-containing protein n=1 Tax=Leptobacterium meishanense TaxID=3128904 RepID=UPI0030ECB17D
MKKYIKYIKGSIYATGLILIFYSCGTNKIVVEEKATDALPARTIIRNHYNNELAFKTIRGRMKIDYNDGGKSESFSLSMRMEKDKAIWLSATLSLVKIYITPTRVSFYNKLDNSYFDGDFSYLSNLLGTEMDFKKVQNLLLGQAIFNLKEEKYKSSVSNNNYQLKPSRDIELFKKLFLIKPGNFKMALQQIAQPNRNRLLNINYKTYQKVDNKLVPNEIMIEAEEQTSKINIAIEYRNIEFDQRVSFPYAIPTGYKRIVLN